MIPALVVGLASALAVDVGDIDIPTLLGYGIVGPAMFWAYRTVSRSNNESEEKAWRIAKRLEKENERLQARIDRLTRDDDNMKGGT